jgi:hypothetical protein
MRKQRYTTTTFWVWSLGIVLIKMITKIQSACFLGTLAVSIIISTVLWECCVCENLYTCTDPLFLDFIFPGDWYHPEHGDIIKAGWSESNLWVLWSSMLATSVVIAFTVSWKFRTKGNQNQAVDCTQNGAFLQ